MKRIYYENIYSFKEAIKPYKIVKSKEGTIYFTKTYVYKVLYSHQTSLYFPSLMKSLSKFNSSLFTIPLFLLYFKNNIGFVMENGGEDLWSLLLNDCLNFKEKKEIANQMKEICSYLDRKGYVHGDIKLENFLYRDGNLRLTDLNYMTKNPEKGDTIRMPDIYKTWYKRCKDGFYVDYLAINYCMYILLNFDFNEIKAIERTTEWCDCFSYSYDRILDSKNKVFDNEIYEKMLDSFKHTEKKKINKGFFS